MGKSKKPAWGQHAGRRLDGDFEYYDEFDSYDEDEEGFEAEMLDPESLHQYLNEAHEALERLNQKTNKRGKQQKRPRGAESWH